jgi:dienelactone hydrolase
MDLAEQLATASHAEALSLIVAEENTGARRLYERLGYQDIEKRPIVSRPNCPHTGNWVPRAAMLLFLAATAGCTTLGTGAGQFSEGIPAETIQVHLASGSADVDVYWPERADQAPLVIIAHGFRRHRRHMSGWGRHLANEGFVVAIPDLPTHSDHVQNGHFVYELEAYLGTEEPWKWRIDPTRVGYLGFSAGGLSSLLAAARSPAVVIWIGLDPVDRDGMGVKTAPMVRARTVVLTAEPSPCNAQGNAHNMIAALSYPEHHRVPGAVHVDAEWPTSVLAESMCGSSTEERRTEFRVRATNALRTALSVSFEERLGPERSE